MKTMRFKELLKSTHSAHSRALGESNTAGGLGGGGNNCMKKGPDDRHAVA